MDNKELARSFRLLAQLMEFYAENEFKVKAVLAAALRISKYPVPLNSLDQESISNLEGFSKSISSKVAELLEKGSLSELETYKERTRPGIIELLGIRGLGPKKILTIFTELDIDSPSDLYYACNENRLTPLKGFGIKSQQEIKKLLEFSFKNKGSYLYPAAYALAETWVDVMRSKTWVDRVEITGDLRRKNEIVQKIQILIDCSSLEQLKNFLQDFENFKEGSNKPNSLSIHESESLLIEFILARKNKFETDWLLTTGNEDHLEKLKFNDDQNFNSEHEIYQSKGLPFIEPELREGRNEIEDSKAGKLSRLIQLGDIRGSIHNHSTYSDGLNTLAEMANACIAMDLQYLVICDHSQSAFYANGLSKQEIIRQHAEIKVLNKSLAPFKIFKGIESDILNDGSLDYPDEILETFDLVVASVHSNLRMDKAKATTRLIKAIANPYTTILGHPTGRLLLGREGYSIDHQMILEACAEYGVSIEINANPNRLDIDWRWISKATEMGIMISINPDAHSILGLQDTRYGINAARKGGLQIENCLNALNQESLEHYLLNKKLTIK